MLAAWNSGQIAYFSGRRTINLDGLVNSPDYYRKVLREGKLAVLEQYLASQRVDYVVDYLKNDLTKTLPEVTALENDDLRIVVWKYPGN